tara:strand:- start:1845 stop:2255 length:411 start_codon:yes stop_codon:yes gene_type:complete
MTVKLIKVFKNKVFKNKKGSLTKYVSKKNKFFKKFGEVYFNEIKYNQTKGWILHKKNTCLIICVKGKIKFTFIDKFNSERKITISSNTGKIIKIPPNIWFCFKSQKNISIIANLIENPHKDSEIKKNQTVKNYFIK